MTNALEILETYREALSGKTFSDTSEEAVYRLLINDVPSLSNADDGEYIGIVEIGEFPALVKRGRTRGQFTVVEVKADGMLRIAGVFDHEELAREYVDSLLADLWICHDCASTLEYGAGVVTEAFDRQITEWAKDGLQPVVTSGSTYMRSGCDLCQDSLAGDRVSLQLVTVGA